MFFLDQVMDVTTIIIDECNIVAYVVLSIIYMYFLQWKRNYIIYNYECVHRPDG